jgi:hypothetical protein
MSDCSRKNLEKIIFGMEVEKVWKKQISIISIFIMIGIIGVLMMKSTSNNQIFQLMI